MKYVFHSVMEIKKQSDFMQPGYDFRSNRDSPYYTETTTYDVSGQRLHVLEISWLRPAQLCQLLLFTTAYFIPAAGMCFVPLLVIFGLLFSASIEVVLYVVAFVSLIGAFWFSRYIIIGKRQESLIRWDRGLEKQAKNFAIVSDKQWEKWLSKLKGVT